MLRNMCIFYDHVEKYIASTYEHIIKHYSFSLQAITCNERNGRNQTVNGSHAQIFYMTRMNPTFKL